MSNEMLENTIETIYQYLDNRSKYTGTDMSEAIKIIHEYCPLLILTTKLDEEDINLFIINFIKYMFSINIKDPSMIMSYFDKLIFNISVTAQLMENPAIKFLQNTETESFRKGFLL